jgi:hypothetical protein
MNAADRTEPAARPSQLDIFTARVEARALLWQAGEFADLPTAVDELQAAAERDGLVSELGQDEVQRILAAAFAASADMVPDVDNQPIGRGVAKSTLEAAGYLIRQGNVDRLHTWLTRHSAEERAAILQYFEHEGRRHASA